MSIECVGNWLKSISFPSVNSFAKIGLVVGSLAITAKVTEKLYKRSVADRPFPHTPKECSPQARSFLATTVPFNMSSDPNIVLLVREAFRAGTQQISDRDKSLYIQAACEEMIGGVPVLIAIPKDYQENAKALIYIHGGAWTLGCPDHLYQIFAPVAYGVSLKTYAIKYRLAPEYPFPHGLDDCVAVYEELLKTHDPKNIFFLGDSAGASLCIAAVLKARDKGLSLPAAVGLYSPVVDIEKNSDTHFTLSGRDPVFLFEQSLEPSFRAYAKGQDPKNPQISVIHADFEQGFPPTTIHVGAREILLGDSCRLNEKLHNSGQNSSLHVFDGLWHGFTEHGFPESNRSIPLMNKFFLSHMKIAD